MIQNICNTVTEALRALILLAMRVLRFLLQGVTECNTLKYITFSDRLTRGLTFFAAAFS